MQQVFNETQPRSSTTASSQNTPSLSQDGFAAQNDGHGQLLRSGGSASPSSSEASHSTSEVSLAGIDIEQFTERLRRLNTLAPHPSDPRKLRGRSIANYESGLVRASPTPRRHVGFKVIPRKEGAPSDGPRIIDMPNEVLTHILSYLNPEGYASLALVSRKFHDLVRSQYAWRVAFRRFFSGQNTLDYIASDEMGTIDWDGDDDATSESHLPTHHYFARLTSSATWQSEYFLRTQLLRSLAKTKPGLVVDGDDKLVKAKFPTLTYDSRVTCVVTSIHAEFVNKEPKFKAVHGGADLGRTTSSNPGTGNIGDWGLTDNFELRMIGQAWPNLDLFGVSQGPAACPNVMDVSVAYGAVSGEGFPGGLPFYRPAVGRRARYIDRPSDISVSHPDIPGMTDVEGISSVWIAKTTSVPDATGSLVGIMTGSTLGVVTTYAVGQRRKLQPGDMSARWVLSPGVPIISLKVDDSYGHGRRQAARVWAVALNALGEVFYLKETPSMAGNPTTFEDKVVNAWLSGRSVQWHLVESTLRQVRRGDGDDGDADPPSYFPRSSSQSSNLEPEGWVAEARQISALAREEPAFFRNNFQGWDMRRRLEVDFAGDDWKGGGESIFVVDCGYSKTQAARIQRYVRTVPIEGGGDGWHEIRLAIPEEASLKITCTTMDTSLYAVTLRSEDPLCSGNEPSASAEDVNVDVRDLPGGRARFMAAGFDNGSVMLWNARHEPSGLEISPLRMVHTDSPKITCLALSALYLVHGGSDGLVQAWDPLGSTLGALKTINTRSGVHVSRHLNSISPALGNSNHAAARCIYLDPDPTKLRGVVSFGAFLRSWSFSSPGQEAARRREKARARPEYDHRRKSDKIKADCGEPDYEKMQSKLASKYGLSSGNLGDLTEEEAVMYAQMISRESFIEDEQRRTASAMASTSARSNWPIPGADAGVDAGADIVEVIEAVGSLAPLDGIQSDEELARKLAELEEADALGGWRGDHQTPHGFDETLIKVTYKKPRNKKARKPSTSSGSGGDSCGPSSSLT